jgi:predicted transcriptional regulator
MEIDASIPFLSSLGAFMNGVELCTLLRYRSLIEEASMRRQFVLDDRSEKLLDHLAASRAGNRSFVVREAIALYASLEDRMAEIEAEPAFERMMRQTSADIKVGRVVSHALVKKAHSKKLAGNIRRAAQKSR